MIWLNIVSDTHDADYNNNEEVSSGILPTPIPHSRTPSTTSTHQSSIKGKMNQELDNELTDDDVVLNKMEKLNNTNSHKNRINQNNQSNVSFSNVQDEFSPIYDGGFHKGLWKAKYER